MHKIEDEISSVFTGLDYFPWAASGSVTLDALSLSFSFLHSLRSLSVLTLGSLLWSFLRAQDVWHCIINYGSIKGSF